MDVSALTSAHAAPRTRYFRRAGDRISKTAGEPKNALEPLSKDRADGPILVSARRVHSASSFIAQLIACVHDFPQMRQRRRASLDETLTAYQPIEGTHHAPPLISRLV